MDENLVINTIGNAIERYGTPEIFNSDQGSQYTAKNTIKLLEKHTISISMDTADVMTNIFMERFWRTIKQEDVYPNRYETLRQARRGIGNYMKTYNYRRLHSSIGYRAPAQAYKQELKRAA